MRRSFCLFLSILTVTALTSLRAQDEFNVAATVNSHGLRGEVSSVDIDNLIKKEYYRTDWEQRPWFTDRLREFLQEADGQIIKFDKSGHITQTTLTYGGTKIGSVNYSYSKGRMTGYEGLGTRVQATHKGSRADVNIYGYGGVVNFKPSVTKNGIDTWDWKDKKPVKSVKGSYQFVYACRQRYNDAGSPIESRYLYVDSTVAKTIHYSYTHRQLLTEMFYVEYRDNKPYDTTVATYAYDTKDNLCKATIRSRSVDEVYSFTNNEYGDPETVLYNNPYVSETYTFTYIYDDLHNWTTRLTYKNGVFDGATLRSITYYSAQLPEEEIYVYFDDEESSRSSAKKSDKKEKVKEESAGKEKQKADKGDKPKKEAKADKKDKAKAEAADKPDKPAKEAKADKEEPAKADKGDKPKKEAKADKTEKGDKSKKAAKSKEADTQQPQAETNPAADNRQPASKPAEQPAKEPAQRPTEQPKQQQPTQRPAQEPEQLPALQQNKKADKPANNNEMQGEEIPRHIYLF